MNEEVWVKIIAVNVYGESEISEPGNDGLVKLIPDAPVSLVNDPSVTDDDKIKFDWVDGASDGGDAVIDFTIYYDQGTGTGEWVILEPGVIEYQEGDGTSTFVFLEEGVPTRYYTTTVTLEKGVTYAFMVRARNTVGLSLYSEPISILVAQPPDAPINVLNVPGKTTSY